MTKYLSLTVAAVGAVLTFPASALDWSLEAGIEGRRFTEAPAYGGQMDDQWSVTLRPELVWDADSGNGRFTFVPFYRKDFADDERTHGDVREALYMTWSGNWELRAGIGKVFWGVTESLHLVDVINQTDYVEAVDGDEKLGQPMVHGILLSDAGTWEAFVLPGFRERTFPGAEGRYRPQLLVSDEASYQAEEEHAHIDVAVRWSYTAEISEYPLDMSLMAFRGTSRAPLFSPLIDGFSVVGLEAFYPMQNQLGATVQFSPEGWLLKAEVVHTDFQVEEFAGSKVEDQTAAVAGFEYTLVGPFGGSEDLGLLMEYQVDSRDDALAQNDLFVGMRYVINDMASSEVLTGITQDLDESGSRLFFLEGSTRLNPSTTLDVTLTAVSAEDDSSLAPLRADDSIEVALNFFF